MRYIGGKNHTDISGDGYGTLFDTGNVEDYFSSWQLLFAAEVADAGFHLRINLACKDVARAATEAVSQQRIPDGVRGWFNLIPVYASRDFAKHERALDAVVWFSEERSREFFTITRKYGGGRFRLSSSENSQYEQASQHLALASVRHFQIGDDDLGALICFLAEYWSAWNHAGRPLIADAYKAFLGNAVILMRRVQNLTFVELSKRQERWAKVACRYLTPSGQTGQKERRNARA